MKRLILAAALVTLAGCSDSPATIRAVEGAGYKDVVTTGHAWFSCSDDDSVATRFEATDQTGRRIKGAYCSNLFFKGGTIRLD